MYQEIFNQNLSDQVLTIVNQSTLMPDQYTLLYNGLEKALSTAQNQGLKLSGKLYIENLNSETDMFATFVKLSHLFGDSKLILKVNPLVFSWNLSTVALEGILLHEICHLADLAPLKLTDFSLIKFVYHYVKQDGAKQYELATDQKAVALGAARGLYEFRLSQQKMLSPSAYAKKLEYYLGPQELLLYSQK